MNFSSIFGIIIGVGVMYRSLTGASENMMMFLNPHGVLIVCGGTLAAASISFSMKDILNLIIVFFKRILGRSNSQQESVIQELIELQKRRAAAAGATIDVPATIKHPFLREAASLLSTGILTETELRNALERRLKTIESFYMHDANMFRTIGKFPPAFGLLATTLGMIALLQKIGQQDSQKLIGPAMAIGLIGTLYGITLANLVFLPIAENLTERTHEEVNLRRMIVEGIILIKRESNPIALREQLNSYILPKKRKA